MGGSPLLDDVHEVLADPERRAALATLAERDGRLSVESLADRVAARLEGRPTPASTIYLRLHHRHLPKLTDAGFVDHDRESGRVSLTGTGRRVQEAADLVADHLREAELA